MLFVKLARGFLAVWHRRSLVGFIAGIFLFCSTLSGMAQADVKSYEDILATISRRSEWPSARFALAEIHFRSKQWGKAIAQWEKLVAEYRNDSLAPKALWRVVTVQSGPLNDKQAAIKTAQLLHSTYPSDPYGERALLGEAMLFYWSNNKARATECANRYLWGYPQGRYVKAANQLLTVLK